MGNLGAVRPDLPRMSQHEMDVLLRNDLATFIQRVFQHLNPSVPCQWNWHLDLISDRLNQVAQGKIPRLIITVPPRSLKSICASVAFPAWLLGRTPDKRILCVSYGQELAEKHARDSLAIMEAGWYHRVFRPNSLLRSAVADIETAQRGGRLATSVGGTLTGRGGDIIIIDDPAKPDEMLSDASRRAVNEWYDNTLCSRLNDKRTGAIVLIMQRLHIDDLVGHVLDKESWEIVNLPAIAQDHEQWHYVTILNGVQTQARRPGDLLHGERESAAILEGLQRSLGSYSFDAQYLQAPVPLGGGLVKEIWLHRYTAQQVPHTFDIVLQSWDTANKESELADYSVCTTWGVKDRVGYLLHVLRERMDFPALKRVVVSQQRVWNASVVLIEDRASGTQLLQELHHEGLWQARPISPIGDKVMRMQAQTPAIQNGFIRFPVEAPWLEEYFRELTSFPRAKYKDQVDSTSQAINWLNEYWRAPTDFRFESVGPRAGWGDEMDQYTDDTPG